MNGRQTVKDKIERREIRVAILTFSLSYAIPLLVQIIVFGVGNNWELNNIVIWGKIFEASGLLWPITTILIIALYNYRIRCQDTEMRKPNKKAVWLTRILIGLSMATWLSGEFTNKAKEFTLYFVATLMLIFLTTGCIGVYKLLEINSKNTQKRRRTKNNWLNK